MSQDDTPTVILRAAGPIFAEKGFQGATVREICRVANVNQASINYHFGDKETLYYKTVQHAHQSRTLICPMPTWDPEILPEIKLYDFVRTLLSRMVGVLEEDRWQTELIFREVIHPTAACRSLVEDYFRPNISCLLEILSEVLPHATPHHVRMQFAFSIIGQALFYRVTSNTFPMIISDSEQESNYQIDQLAKHIAGFSWSALLSLSQAESAIVQINN